jgi:lipid-A-disaccharide synthase
VAIREHKPDAQFIVARAPHLENELFRDVSPQLLGSVAVVEGQTDAALGAADVALVASGTATVQAALHDTPMVIVYRVSAVSYWLGKRLVTLDTFGMVNLIAGEKIVPELLQDSFTPGAVASEAISMLTDAARVARIRSGLAHVRGRLGESGASRRAALAILRVASAAKACAN